MEDSVTYTVSLIAPKTVQLIKDPTTQWVLSYPTLEEIQANPFSSAAVNDTRTVQALLRRQDGSEYYLENPANLIGWDVKDCVDVAPVVTHPDEPVQAYKAPQGAIKFPHNEVKLYIRTKVPTYNSANGAMLRLNPTDKKLTPGSYITNLTKQGMLRIKDDESLKEVWINPNDNVVKPPTPAKPKPSSAITPERKKQHLADLLASFREYRDTDTKTGKSYPVERCFQAKPGGALVVDFEGTDSRTMPAGATTWLIGWFVEDDSAYGLATKCVTFDAQGEIDTIRWVGVRMSDLDNAFDTSTTLEERQYLKTLTFGDRLALVESKIRKTIQGVFK